MGEFTDLAMQPTSTKEMDPIMTVYTAITEGKDELRSPIAKHPGVRYVAFVDSATSVSGWEILPAETRFSEPRLNAKAHKIWPHVYLSNSPITLWVDGTHLPRQSFLELVPALLDKADIRLFAHPWRNCVYVEGDLCSELSLDSTVAIRQQLSYYRSLGHPSHGALFATGVILRRDSPLMRQVARLWWRQIRCYSRRDQISFPFVARQLGVAPAVIPGHIYESRWFEYKPHRR